MKDLLSQVVSFMLGFGGLGVLVLAALDSSVLFLPFGVDILLVTASARDEDLSLVYAALATIGSLIGTSFVWYLAKKGGEAGLERLRAYLAAHLPAAP